MKKITGVLEVLFIFSFGCYLLYGAYFGLIYAKWPYFMPPQLDIFGLIFTVFGEQAGAYVGACFLGLLGLFFLFIATALLLKSKFKRQ